MILSILMEYAMCGWRMEWMWIEGGEGTRVYAYVVVCSPPCGYEGSY